MSQDETAEILEKSPKHILHQDLGNLIDLTTIEYGLVGCTTNGFFRVMVYNSRVIRVQISTTEIFDEFSYSVIAVPEQTKFKVSDSEDCIRVRTAEMEVEIVKKPVRFKFFDQQGRLINEDCPGLGISLMGDSKSLYKTLQPDERFIGLGEKTGNLDRRGSGYTNWNTDNFAYTTDADPLYCSIPFYIGLHSQLVYGIFLDNTYQSHFNFGASNDRFSSFSVQGGDLNYYFIYGSSVADLIASYTHLTGRMPMPPLWGLGYQQCRYSYYPDLEVYNLANTFRGKKIPADAIVLDIHYMDGYKIFTWDEHRFPDPEKMINDLKDLGFNVVVMCDPGIMIEQDYQTYKEGLEGEVFLKYPDGINYSGQVWPGWCHFPDFTNPDARKWWGEQVKQYVVQGIRGYWNDMNEIATWGQKLPDLLAFDFEGEGGSTKRGRNIYGLMMSKSTYEGVKKQLGNERVFNLTRAGFSGVQRYAAVWTGDNVSNDEHMLLGVRLVNSLGLSGIAYAGYDVGGFVGEASGALFARWISIGAFSPFFRGHTMINSKDSEPWSYGEEVEDISRNYINLRYQLIPYLYSVFYQASTTGIPVARTLALDYPFDDEIYHVSFQNQYLFGPNILVAPVESYRHIAKVYLPAGRWFNFHSEELHRGQSKVYTEAPLTHLPLFVKAGSIIPMQSIIQSTQEDPEPIMHLHVYGGAAGEFIYYEDDGRTDQYLEGQYYRRKIIYNEQDDLLIFGQIEGALTSRFTEIKCYLHGFQGIEKVKISGRTSPLKEESLVFLPPVSSFDPLGKESVSYPVSVKTFTIENSNKRIRIEFITG